MFALVLEQKPNACQLFLFQRTHFKEAEYLSVTLSVAMESIPVSRWKMFKVQLPHRAG